MQITVMKGGTIVSQREVADFSKVFRMGKRFHTDALIFGSENIAWNTHILYERRDYDTEGLVTAVTFYREFLLDEDMLEKITAEHPNSYFGVIHVNNCAGFLKDLRREIKGVHFSPITLKEANAFVKKYHRHHDEVTGCKFALALMDFDNKIIGVAICGRPVSRHLDDGKTIEVNRLCVQCPPWINGCSLLYSQCAKIARGLGYQKIITYILESESGASLKASNFVLEDARCGGKRWNRNVQNPERRQPPEELKQRWSLMLA